MLCCRCAEAPRTLDPDPSHSLVGGAGPSGGYCRNLRADLPMCVPVATASSMIIGKIGLKKGKLLLSKPYNWFELSITGHVNEIALLHFRGTVAQSKGSRFPSMKSYLQWTAPVWPLHKCNNSNKNLESLPKKIGEKEPDLCSHLTQWKTGPEWWTNGCKDPGQWRTVVPEIRKVNDIKRVILPGTRRGNKNVVISGESFLK